MSAKPKSPTPNPHSKVPPGKTAEGLAARIAPGITPKPPRIPLHNPDLRPYLMIEKSLGTGDLTKLAQPESQQ